MIERDTVLVLGAGASTPYGFPVGSRLVDYVVKNTRKPAYNLYQLLGACGFSGENINEFRTHLDLSMQPSVDAFVETRPEFMDIGKCAIAAGLIPCEKEAMLYRDTPQHWYRYLFERMGPKLDDFRRSRLAILTFNYDRSFEHFLYLALQHSFNLSDEEYRQFLDGLDGLPIIHLYGQLGSLPYIVAEGRPYLPNIDQRIVRETAKQIRIIHETPEDDKVFKTASYLIERAEVLSFLGFRYHLPNLERLRLPDVLREGTAVFGSAFGMTHTEIDATRKVFGREVVFGNDEQDALLFLRNHPVL